MIPFCDWLSTSHPLDARKDVIASLRDALDVSGFSQRAPGTDAAMTMFDTADGGLVRIGKLHDVAVVSASGAALRALRAGNVFADYLHALGSGPHRVTTLHATMDVYGDAATVVADAYARGHAGQIALSRKAVRPADVTCHLSRRPDGRDSGTVYIGGSRDQVRAAIYDKQLERLGRNAPDPGPVVRYEMRIKGRLGATLRDAWDPTGIFYHVASPGILPRPNEVLDWQPAAEGFTLPTRTEVFTPWQLIERKLDNSPDVDRMLDLCVEAGPHGIDLLCSKLRQRLAQRALAPGQPRAAERPQAETPGQVH